MSVDAKLITVVQAIKQSVETAAGPGVSVNSHPNPFFLNVNGAIDLKHAATLIIQRLEAFEADVKAKRDLTQMREGAELPALLKRQAE